MALMEFLGQNKLNTTSMVAVDSGTASVENLFDRNTSFQHITIGYPGTSVTTIAISMSSAVISHVLLRNHNLKNFSIYYDGTTTNSLFSTTTNSATATYLAFASITVSSIHVRMVEAMDSLEKHIGEILVAERKLVFERNPTINSYAPETYRKQVVHAMPDGGTTVFNIRDKFRAKLAWEYVTVDFRDDLMALYRTGEVLNFLTAPTATGWNGEAFEVAWLDKFDFRYSSNVQEAGFSGSILLQQTPSA